MNTQTTQRVVCIITCLLLLSYWLYNTNGKLISTEKVDNLANNFNKLFRYLGYGDVRFVLEKNNSYVFYGNKDILGSNSPYFYDLFNSNNTVETITYNDITVEEFKLVFELLNHNKFQSTLQLQYIPNIVRYADNYQLLNQHHNYLDDEFSKLLHNFNNTCNINYIYEINNIYLVAKQYELNYVLDSLYKNIYYNWKNENQFNVNHLYSYPNLFYDFIKQMNCYELIK